MSNLYPERIVCLTEESVELFHLLGRSELIAGVSVYAKRPAAAGQHAVISSFTHANTKKILSLKPDLVVGFSDIQKDIARDLIDAGVNVLITNQRSIDDIFKYISLLGNIIGETKKTNLLVDTFKRKIDLTLNNTKKRGYRPRVYIEEWDKPQICGIRWFSELVEICGGTDIFHNISKSGSKAFERFVTNQKVQELNPEVILASWCGKKVDIDSIYQRSGFHEVIAIKEKRVFELEPEIFLQPGPALFVDGLDRLSTLLDSLNYP